MCLVEKLTSHFVTFWICTAQEFAGVQWMMICNYTRVRCNCVCTHLGWKKCMELLLFFSGHVYRQGWSTAWGTLLRAYCSEVELSLGLSAFCTSLSVQREKCPGVWTVLLFVSLEYIEYIYNCDICQHGSPSLSLCRISAAGSSKNMQIYFSSSAFRAKGWATLPLFLAQCPLTKNVMLKNMLICLKVPPQYKLPLLSQ